MFPDKIYYEPEIKDYELGRMLTEKYKDKEWIEIESHNNIEELRKSENKEFAKLKRLLIIGTRKTHKYISNFKVSDFLVPYTSSGCSAMCMYCYLVCNYNKCAYLRLFVNREEMFNRLVKTANKYDKDMTFEIGSNSDLVLENTITGNLEWTIENFGKSEKGYITFPSKFCMVDSLLKLEHKGRSIFRMSVNPMEIVQTIEVGTSPLTKRIKAINEMVEAGYKTGILIAPVIMVEDWKSKYSELIEMLNEMLTEKTKKQLFIEVIFMTYSFVQRAINNEAFPQAFDLYSKESMVGRGRGKYCYRENFKEDGEQFIRSEIEKKLPGIPIIYIC